jgi:ATP-dependent DNA helicase RecG
MAMQIIALLEKEPLAKSEIVKRLGKAKPSRYLNDLMRKLLQAGRVEYTIPDKPISRLQKYKLTKNKKEKTNRN